MMRIRLMYKIHNARVARGVSRSAGNDTFYETEEEALEAARGYVSQDHCRDSMVIYKAHVVVQRSHPPVEILSIQHDGEIVPFR